MSAVRFDQLIVNATISRGTRLNHCLHFGHNLSN